MKNKNILLITIIFVVILLSAIYLNLSDVSSINKIGIFTTNLTTIQDYITSCNLMKEELPFDGDILVEDVKLNMTEEYLEKFIIELENRGDSETVSVKKIDLNKIGVHEDSTGFGENGENDIYVYSENTDTVYYLMGIKYNGDIYFCINNKITNIIKE